jgi:hypothetical protein
MQNALRPYVLLGAFILLSSVEAMGGSESDTSANARQYYSGMAGFYNPRTGINNGIILSADGVTEFRHSPLFVSGSLDAYLKQTFSIFDDPQPGGGPPPRIADQQMILLPIHVNVGFRVAKIEDADMRFYAGAGAGYYLYFYSATYSAPTNNVLASSEGPVSDARNGGAFFTSVFARVSVNQFFIEPRYYFASARNESLGGYALALNPTGFAVLVGIEYH